MNEWIKVEVGNPLPDDKPEVLMGEHDFMPVIVCWSDGKVEVADYHYIGIDQPTFQRKCGTNENCVGWNGDVGYVTHWMHIPKPPTEV